LIANEWCIVDVKFCQNQTLFVCTVTQGDCFGSLSGIKHTTFYSTSFRFDISIVRCLGGCFFSRQCRSPRPASYAALDQNHQRLQK